MICATLWALPRPPAISARRSDRRASLRAGNECKPVYNSNPLRNSRIQVKMKASARLATLLIQALLLTGCAKPDRIVRVNSPVGELFLTVETWHGQGAISNDFTRIYAHFENKGKSDKELVLDGEYLEDTKVIWLNPSELKFCVPYGSPTDSFRSNLTLRAGDESWRLHSRLQENCNSVASETSDESPPRLKRR
jgi:hypothetical protein